MIKNKARRRIGAIAVVLVVGWLAGCSGSSPSESKSASSWVASTYEGEWGRRPAEIVAQWFEDLPSPLPAPLAYVEGASTIAVLPDTQVYSDKYPDVFEHQARYIAQQREAFDIRFVAHVGDVTERGSEREWQTALGAMSLLEGVVPYGIALGNHDYGGLGWANTRDTLFGSFFSMDRLRKMGALGGTQTPGVPDNSFHLFSAGGRDWIVLMLEWGPRREVVQWGNKMLRTYADRAAIVVTHAYMYHDDTRYDRIRSDQAWSPYSYPTADLDGGVSDGEDLWRDLVALHGNVAMVLSGHVLGDGGGYLPSKGRVGNTVHQMLSNYQMLPGGGQGYMRMLELMPDGTTVQVKTYSPVLDDYLTGERHQFVIKLDVRLGRPCKGSAACNPYEDVVGES